MLKFLAHIVDMFLLIKKKNFFFNLSKIALTYV